MSMLYALVGGTGAATLPLVPAGLRGGQVLVIVAALYALEVFDRLVNRPVTVFALDAEAATGVLTR